MIAKYIQALLYWPVLGLLKFFFRYEVRGQENFAGIKGAFIIAPNHTSWIDSLIIATAMPKGDKWYPKDFFPVRFPVTERFFKWYYIVTPILLRANGCIKLGKNGHALRNIITALQNKRKRAVTCIFPEGRFDDVNEGKIQKGRPGIVYAHRESGAVIVPVGVLGGYGSLSWKSLFRINRIIVNIGQPIYGLGNPEQYTLVEGVQVVMDKIEALIKEVANEKLVSETSLQGVQ